jgi:hypothetical protein
VELRRSVELGRRVDNVDGGRVNMCVLNSNGVVILVVVVHLSIENAGNGHVEDLALIVTRGAAHGSTARSATLLEGTHSRDLGALLSHHRRTEVNVVRRRGEDIGVFQVNGVVILAVLVDLGVGLDIGRVGAGEATIAIISGRTAHGGATSLWLVTILLPCSSLASVSVY